MDERHQGPLDQVLHPNIPMKILLSLQSGAMHREALFRATGTGTGYLRKFLPMLIEHGLVTTDKPDRKRIIYSLTPRGMLVALAQRALYHIPEVHDERIMREITRKYADILTYMSRMSSGELFDPGVAAALDSNLPFSKKLHALVDSIMPWRVFSLDELCKEYNRIYPGERKEKGAFSTCITRFKDDDNGNHMPQLRHIQNGTYMIEGCDDYVAASTSIDKKYAGNNCKQGIN